MVANPPVLLFRGNPEMPTKTFGWTGSWPPPTSLMLVVGKLTGKFSVVEPDDLSEERVGFLRELRETKSITEHVYTREGFSGLSPSIDDLQDSHVVRAASYVHVETNRYDP